MIQYSTFQQNKRLSELTTLAIGGPARFFVEVKDVVSMQEILRFCAREKLSFFVLGKGSNCLFTDAGFDGVVIQNKIDFFEELSNGRVHVGAGFSFSLLGIQTAKKGLSGLEFAAGIPASVGGAVFMNAGAQGSETKNALESVDFVDESGNLRTFLKEELHFSYRHSSFQSMRGAIVGATFCLTATDTAKSKQRTLLDYRIKTQPYHEKSAGCVFRNPEGHSAGALIEQCGLKGFSVNGAAVSTMHANFLINRDSAASSDMKALIELVREKVKEKTGIDLEPELRIVS